MPDGLRIRGRDGAAGLIAPDDALRRLLFGAEGVRRQPGRVEFLPARTVGEDEDGLSRVIRAGLNGSARFVGTLPPGGLA